MRLSRALAEQVHATLRAQAVEIVIRAIVGGGGTLFGPILGSFILTPLGETLTGLTEGFRIDGIKQFFWGLCVAVIVLFRPAGKPPIDKGRGMTNGTGEVTLTLGGVVPGTTVPLATMKVTGFDGFQVSAAYVEAAAAAMLLPPLVLGLPLAALLTRARLRGMAFFRTVVFLPQVVAMVVVAVLGPGLVNAVLAVALVAWAAWAVLTFEIGARLMPAPQTRADIGQLLRTIGFASTPGLLRGLGIMPAVAMPVFVVTSVWMLLAMIVAVRQALDYRSTASAIAVCLLGWVLAIVVAVVLGVLFGPTVS